MPAKSHTTTKPAKKPSRKAAKAAAEASRRSDAISAGSAGTYEPDTGRPVRVIGQDVIDHVRQLSGPIMGPIGERLADKLQSGISTTQLAAAIGTTQSTLYRTMTGRVEPKESVLRLLCEYFGLELQPTGSTGSRGSGRKS